MHQFSLLFAFKNQYADLGVAINPINRSITYSGMITHRSIIALYLIYFLSSPFPRPDIPTSCVVSLIYDFHYLLLIECPYKFE
jgi:hypothetical protein